MSGEWESSNAQGAEKCENKFPVLSIRLEEFANQKSKYYYLKIYYIFAHHVSSSGKVQLLWSAPRATDISSGSLEHQAKLKFSSLRDGKAESVLARIPRDSEK